VGNVPKRLGMKFLGWVGDNAAQDFVDSEPSAIESDVCNTDAAFSNVARDRASMSARVRLMQVRPECRQDASPLPWAGWAPN
jgi:hypothetical protein